MAGDEHQSETRECPDCHAEASTPDVATFLYPDGDVVVTEMHTRDCPTYVRRWKPLVDDIKRTREEDTPGHCHDE